MAYVTPDTVQENYDVVIVGSGAGGGQTAYTLAMEGAKVLILEAGRNYDVAKETPMFQTNRDAPLRGAGTPDKPFGFHDATIDGGWTVPGEPYSSASDDPRRRFMWWRARMLGGRTNHWGRISLRNGPYDFKPYSRDGLGFDWPISYEDVEPYYDKVEMLIGVHGSNDGLENTPNSSPGVLQPPPKPRLGELLMQQRAKALGMFGTKERSVIHLANPAGIAEVVGQQFEVATQVLRHGLVPIIEPEVSIKSPERAQADEILRDEILRHLDRLPEGHEVMLKLSIPARAGTFDALIQHPRVLRVVALSGGYSRSDACRELAKNPGMIASFSRALLEDLRQGMSDADFDRSLAEAIDEIYEASTEKIAA